MAAIIDRIAALLLALLALPFALIASLVLLVWSFLGRVFRLDRGRLTNEPPVEERKLPESDDEVEPQDMSLIIVAASSRRSANGEYHITSQRHDSRPIWEKTRLPNRFLFYSAKKRKWYISDKIEDNGYERAASDSISPLGLRWEFGATLALPVEEQHERTVDINVRSIAGTHIATVQVPASATALELKTKLCLLKGVPVYTQRLVLPGSGDVLDDDFALEGRPDRLGPTNVTEVQLIRMSYDGDTGQNLIEYLLWEADVSQVEQMLRGLADPNCQQPESLATPLSIAARGGHEEVARLLCDAGAENDKAMADGATPLFVAALNGHIGTTCFLCDNGADKDQAKTDGLTPMHIASCNGHLQVARYLCETGATADPSDPNGITPLLLAASRGHLSVVQLLRRTGADVHKQMVDGSTPLMAAAEIGHLPVVKFLTKAKAQVDQQRSDGSTACWLAAQNGHVDAVKFLCGSNADPASRRNNGSTPLLVAAYQGHSGVVAALCDAGAENDGAALGEGYALTPLVVATQRGDLEMVKLLIDHGANDNRPLEDGTTPLITAALYGHVEVLRLFCSRGASMNHQNQEGLTPLVAAAFNGHVEAVDFLLEAGAGGDEGSLSPLFVAACNGHLGVVNSLCESRADFNMSKSDGATPLFIAACNGKLEVIRFLCERKADINKANTQGLTPLRVASVQGFEEISQCLKDHGAKLHVGEPGEEDQVASESPCSSGGSPRRTTPTCCSAGLGRWFASSRKQQRGIRLCPDAERANALLVDRDASHTSGVAPAEPAVIDPAAGGGRGEVCAAVIGAAGVDAGNEKGAGDAEALEAKEENPEAGEEDAAAGDGDHDAVDASKATDSASSTDGSNATNSASSTADGSTVGRPEAPATDTGRDASGQAVGSGVSGA